MNRRLALSPLAASALALVLTAATGCAADADDGATEGQSADAFTDVSFGPSPSDFPTESGWAIARVRRACRLTASQVEGATGKMLRLDGRVMYTVTKGDRSWSAVADSDSIFVRPFCMPE
jgi:hypothetical protein